MRYRIFMPKITQILFIPLLLSLLCCDKDKESQSNQAILEIDPDLEECDSLCEYTIANYERFFDQEEYVKEIKAIYEDSLKKNAPKCKKYKEPENDEHFDKIVACEKLLKLALKMGFPYPTVEEKIEEDEKIKSAFKEKFGMPIADFELSIVGVRYSESTGMIYSGILPKHGGFEFSAVRTATGASGNTSWHATRYGTENFDEETADIDMDTWLDFIWALQEYEINKWERTYYANNDNNYNPDASRGGWVIKIYHLDKEGYIEEFKSGGTIYRDSKMSKNYPPNFAKVMEAVEKFRTKIRKSMYMKLVERARKSK